MSGISFLYITTTILASCVYGDVYMHSPRGSNNRLNEKSANRNNANRIFDSQNNNRGGYNVGDRDAGASGQDESKQYQMKYFQSSISVHNPASKTGKSFLPIEWTNQHGCGGNEDSNPNKLNCHIVLQYMCQQADGPGAIPLTEKMVRIKDGTDTGTTNYIAPRGVEKKVGFNTRKGKIRGNNNSKGGNKGIHEPLEWYDKCRVRIRNKGLFIADQRVGENAINTRQNPNGNRYGWECPEERDYYPYWHPTTWKDIGILAENESMCEYFQKESFNVKSKCECVEKWPDANEYKHYSQHNNKEDCEKAKGSWLEFHNYLEKAPQYKNKGACNGANKNNGPKYIWGRPIFEVNEQCLVGLDKPTCSAAPFSRDNHLGNGVNLEALNYTWTLPYFPSKTQQRCVLRIRYNITTDDYDPYYTNASMNRNLNPVVMSPIQQNPAIDVGANNVPLRLAINTAQYGRTFQDRSHVFLLNPRFRGNGAQLTNAAVINIYNLNVRGKRGNIVQVYPAVEYDFFPTNLVLGPNDFVHIQWTGSNTHNNGPPGGDGQTGNDGEGTPGTDRHNVCPIKDRLQNFPLPLEDPEGLFNAVTEIAWTDYGDKATLLKNKMDIAIQFGSAGYYKCVATNTKGCSKVWSLELKKTAMDNLLNNAPASFAGMVLRFKQGSYHYMCSRNNNFSNRSQKGTIVVK